MEGFLKWLIIMLVLVMFIVTIFAMTVDASETAGWIIGGMFVFEF